MSGSDRSIRSYTLAVLVLTFVWAVWNESYSTKTIIEGVVLGNLVLIVTNRYLLRGAWHRQYAVSPVTLLRYVGVLVVEIFRSGVHAIYVTVTDRINVGIVDLPTEVSDPLVGVLVANAITLTPGTVTIDYDRKRYKVVWIDCSTDDPLQAAEMIKGSFERVFQRRDS
ncbi:MAG: hypothetical protein EA427_09660 [Spirochaetaceae bacterium]|nr:MAG: hypothetical protein EA427_09660 [Spirochaetaceae bacterium]